MSGFMQRILDRLNNRMDARAMRHEERDLQDLLNEAGAEGAQYARINAPFDTGALRESIGYRIEGDEIVISATVPYAPYVEYGTGMRGENPTGPYVIRPVRAQALRFVVNGRVVFAKKVTHRGIKAQPFLRPALRHAAGVVNARGGRFKGRVSAG